MQGRPNPLQHNREWWLARRGKLTASRIARVVHGTMKGWHSFMDELEAETLMPTMPDRFPHGAPRAIQWGWDQEAMARASYEMDTLEEVSCVGFAQHPTIAQLGASSDFIVPALRINGEIKSPYTQSNHLRVVMNRQIPAEYLPQVQCQMWCHGFETTHFVSYDPRHPDWRSRKAVVAVNIDPSYIEIMGNRIADFLLLYNAGRRPRDVGRPLTIPKLF